VEPNLRTAIEEDKWIVEEGETERKTKEKQRENYDKG
jgi:hypothetical protein